MRGVATVAGASEGHAVAVPPKAAGRSRTLGPPTMETARLTATEAMTAAAMATAGMPGAAAGTAVVAAAYSCRRWARRAAASPRRARQLQPTLRGGERYPRAAVQVFASDTRQRLGALLRLTPPAGTPWVMAAAVL
ncbi:hypothetical protein MMPV_001879 [Pyropia vietnamensis]